MTGSGSAGHLAISTSGLLSVDTSTYITGNQTITLTGAVAGSGTTSIVTTYNTVPATSGGTGQTSYTIGDLLYASSTTALSKLADVATGSALISGGVGVAPSWGKIALASAVSGTLPYGNGGTGLSAPGDTAGNLRWNGLDYTIDATAYLTSSTGVSSITGTANQVIASASVGAVTLSLPQSIATNSSPTFAAITAGQAAMTTWAGASNFAWFGHNSQNNTTNGNSGYLQLSDGSPFVCAPTGKSVAFQVGGGGVMVLNTTTATLYTALSGTSATFSGNVTCTGGVSQSIAPSLSVSLVSTATQLSASSSPVQILTANVTIKLPAVQSGLTFYIGSRGVVGTVSTLAGTSIIYAYGNSGAVSSFGLLTSAAYMAVSDGTYWYLFGRN
jgi:hypothetical protein